MTQLDLFKEQIIGLDKNEAPEGFYAVSKDKATTPNCCDSCDARSLCVENKEGWCLKNRCMSYDIFTAFKDGGKTYNRKDRQSVIFKHL